MVILAVRFVLLALGIGTAARSLVVALRAMKSIDLLEDDLRRVTKDPWWRARLGRDLDYCHRVLNTRLAMIPIGLLIVVASISPLPRLLVGWLVGLF